MEKYKIILAFIGIAIAGVIVFSYYQNQIALQDTEKDFAYPPPGIVYSDKLIPAGLWKNPEEFAQKLVSITNDKITEKRIDDGKRLVYTTEKGNLILEKDQSLDFSQLVNYGLYGNNTIPKERATEFVDHVMKEISYVRDGSEWVESVDYGSYLQIVIQQRKDGWIIQNEITRFTFWPDNTQIYLGRWYDNPSQVKIQFSQDDAKKISYEYTKSLKDEKLQECGFVSAFPQYANMEMVNDSLVYSMSTGSCSKESWEGHYAFIEVLVDAVNGHIVGWRYGPLE